MILRLIAFVAALSGATWIDVPFIRQDVNGCGSASVWMLMEYWKKSPQPVEEIHRILYSEQADGVFASDMERYLADHGFQTVAFSGEWTDLVENVSGGRPIIVCLRASSKGTPLHYVVVAGIQSQPEAILVNDPARRKLVPINRAEFEERWEETHRWALLALPTEPAPDDVSSRPALPAASNVNLESASAAFRTQDYALAKRLARRALQNAPADPLANDFLGTVYFLEDNLDAALKYWNRVEKPRIHDVSVELQTAISRSAVLHEDDYQLARKRFDASGLFSRYVFDLKPTEGEDFDLDLRVVARRGVKPVGWLRGLPYQSLTPEIFNIRGRQINVESLLRWDHERRRGLVTVSGPVGESLRYRIGFDSKNEFWGTVPVRKREAGFTLERVASSRLTWSSGVVAGTAIKHHSGLVYDWFRAPERKLTVSSGVSAEIGRSSGRFARAETDTRVSWQSAKIRFRNGRIVGKPPLGELFSVGLDRDHDLWMRAHRDRLIGRRYVLLNSEVEHRILDWSFVDLKLAPFLDVARVGGSFVDTGVDFRLSIASLLTFSLSVGRDLKAGETVVFTNVTR